MSFLNRNHLTEAAPGTVTWTEAKGAFTYSAKIGSDWLQVPVMKPFAMDVWTAQHGYEFWLEVGGKRSRQSYLVSVSKKLCDASEVPGLANDDKVTCIYSVPVYSVELGGRRDLIIKGSTASRAFCDLFDELEVLNDEAGGFKASHFPVPIIEVDSEATDFGSAPVFKISDWLALRPVKWSKPTVSFD